MSLVECSAGEGSVTLTPSLFDETATACTWRGGRYRLHVCPPIVTPVGNLRDHMEGDF